MTSLHAKSGAHAAIDERVLAVIRGQPGVTFKVVCAIIQSHAGSITAHEIDRSLQRLRKRGQITYGGPGTTFSGWRVA